MHVATASNTVQLVFAAASGLFWTLAYVLIVRRGFKDQTFGVPASSLGLNTSWEFLFAFVYPTPSPLREVNMTWFALDALMLYQCFRFGRADYTPPLVRKWFPFWLTVGCAIAFTIEFVVIEALQDTVGRISGTLSGLVMSIVMNTLVFRRGSVRGQSVYIALSMFLGNVFGYLLALDPNAPGPAVPHFFFHCLFACVLSLNLFYVWLVARQCRAEGISPWTRW